MSRSNKRETGARYERIAGAYLEGLGYRILEYNYRCRAGEIDLIARDGEYLVFVEVKYRADEKSGFPSEAVDVRKQRRISRCALYYMTCRGLSETPCRFDVVGILGEEIRLYRNAFDYVGEAG